MPAKPETGGGGLNEYQGVPADAKKRGGRTLTLDYLHVNLHVLIDPELEKLARPIFTCIIRGSNAGDYSLISGEFTNEL